MFYTNTSSWEILNYQPVQHPCQSPDCAASGSVRSAAPVPCWAPSRGWWLLSPHPRPKPVGPRSCLQPQAASCLCASEKRCATVPGSFGNRAVTSQGEHPQTAKEGFWAAAKLIPALISTKINCNRGREAHQHLKPPITEIPVHLHTAAPSLWTWHALPGTHLAQGLWSLSSIPLQTSSPCNSNNVVQ